MEDKDPWTEAPRTYANLLPSARYLTKAVIDQREEDNNRRWLRSSPISVPDKTPAQPAGGAPDEDFATDDEDDGVRLTGRVIARYSPDSAGRLRIEFGFLPEWAFTATANTEAAVERYYSGDLLPRARYISTRLLANSRDAWLRSSLIPVPVMESDERARPVIDIPEPVLRFDQLETVEEGTRVGTIEGLLSDQLDPITITGTPPGLTIRAIDAGPDLKRLILSGTVPGDAPIRSYGVTITARPPTGDPVSETLTIRIERGSSGQELMWNGYSPDTERVGGRVTFRTPRVVVGPSSPRWAYSSDTPRICTVDPSTGQVTLVATGQCRITATSAAAEGFSEGAVQTIITVTDKPVPEIRWQGYTAAEAKVREPAPALRLPTATVDGRSIRLIFTYEVDEDSERDGICDVNTRNGEINALDAGTCVLIAKSAETDDYAAAESDPVRITIIKEKPDPDLRWDGYDVENFRVGADPISPRAPEPRLREARGKLTYTYSATPRSVCSVVSSTGELAALREGLCDVTVRSGETDDFLADEVTVLVRISRGPQPPDLFWFDYPAGSAVVDGEAIMPSRPTSRDRVGPLTYRSETPGICSVDSQTGRLSGRSPGTCRVTVMSAETQEWLEASETLSVPVSRKQPPPTCTLSYSGDVNVGEQIESSIECGDGDGRARYETETSRFCAVNPNSGDVTGLERGQCRITATVPETSRYAQATARATLTVISNPPPQCDDIADVGPLDPGESGRSIGLNSYCWDPDGERLTYDAQSSDTNVATVRISGDSLTVTAARDGDGSATISVTATDPANQNARISFRVTVEGNEAPVCQSVSDVTINENDSETVTIRCSDGDGDRITLSPESSNRRIATASVSGSRITVRGESAGTATITVTADDGNGGTDSVRFGVTVRTVVSLPVINSISCMPSSPSVDQSVTCTASLSGGTPTSYSWSGGASNGNRSTYTTSFGTSGHKTVSLTVRNTTGSANNSTTVQVPEQAPVIDSISCSSSSPSVDESVTCTARLSGGTPDTYSWSGGASNGNRSTYTTSFGTHGSKTVSLTVSNSGGSDNGSTSIRVLEPEPEEQRPVVNSINCSPSSPNVDESVTCTASLSGGTPTSYSWSGGASSGSSSTYLTSFGRSGGHSVSLTASNNAGSGSNSLGITVPNPPPACSGSSLNIDEDVESGIQPSNYCSDPEGERLTFEITSSATNVASADYYSRSARWVISGNGHGTATITIKATDPGGRSDNAQIRVTVRGMASCGTISSVLTTTNAGSQTINLNSYCRHPASGSLTYSNASSDNTGVANVSLSGSTLTITPGSSTGVANISVSVSGSGLKDRTVSNWFEVIVNPPRIVAPTVNSISCSPSSPRVNQSVTCTASLSGDPPTSYSWSGGASSGSSSTYSTSFSSWGSKTVSLTVRNSAGSDSSFLTNIQVTEVPPTLRAVRCPSTADVGESVRCTASVRDGTPTSWSWSGGSSTGSGQDYRVSFSSAGTYTIYLTVSNSGGSDSGSDSIRVMRVPPTVRSMSCTSKVEASSTISCTAQTRGGTATSWSWSASGGGRSGSGSGSYSTSINSFGRHTISLTVSNDGGSDSDSETVQIVATPPSSTYSRCGSDNIRVYWFDRTNLNKHHVNMTGDEATRVLGAAWWSTIGHMSQGACDSWPTGAALTAANYQ